MIITISQSRNPKLIFICFLLVILFLIKTSSAISIYELLNNTNNILKFSGEIVISFNVIIIGFIILIVVGIILNWIFKDKALIVLPFEVISSDEKYSGKAISESIVSEFNRISQIHNSGPSPIELISDVRRAFSLPLDKAKVDLENGLSSGPLNLGSGTLGFGSSSISIQELLVLLKRKFPFRAHAPIVSGTIQNCNGKLSNLIATLDETSRSKTFEIKFKDSSSLRDLAYIISFELNKEKIHTKTWRGFKHITETIYLYNKYYLNKDVNDLSHAKDECLNVIKLEPENTLLIGLIYNLSIGCLNEKLYKEAKTLLINSVEINGNEYYIINMLGIALGYLGEIEDALECFDKAIKIDPGDESAYVNKGWSLHHMGRDKESIICYEKAKEINENSSIIWDNYGVAYFALGEYKRAIECYTKAIDIEKFKWAFYNRCRVPK